MAVHFTFVFISDIIPRGGGGGGGGGVFPCNGLYKRGTFSGFRYIKGRDVTT